MDKSEKSQRKLDQIHPLIYPHHYQPDGNLKVPPLIYAILLLLSRGWILLIIAAASRNHGNELLSLFYPDRGEFNFALLPGAPALLLLLTLPYRHKIKPSLRRLIWPLISGCILVDVSHQVHSLLLQQGLFNWPQALVLLALFWSFIALFFSPRLKHWRKYLHHE